MQINVLIVDDDTTKISRMREVLVSSGLQSERVQYALNLADAVDALERSRFDLMLLDINLPRRLGEDPRRGEGLNLFKELDRNPALHRPRYIVGVTAYEDAVQEFGDQFAEKLWSVVHYEENSDYWVSQVTSKADYVRAVRSSDNFSDGKTFGIDLAIICALGDVEFGAVKRLPYAWQPLRLPFDQTNYITGTITSRDHRPFAVVAAAAPRMGMPASAALAGKMIAAFRPRMLTMAGICAGRYGKVGLGDIIVGSPTYDWGSGKIDSVDDKPRFRPSPHHVEIDVDIAGMLEGPCEDVGLLARIKQEARGKKPSTELKAKVGAIASGAAVVANEEVFEFLLDKNRDVLGIDMEAYAVALACENVSKPRPVSLICKSVCDFADKDKDSDYQEYAAETSALFLNEIARLLLTSNVVP